MSNLAHFPGRPSRVCYEPSDTEPRPDNLVDGLHEARGVIVGVGWATVGLTVIVSAGFLLWRLAMAAGAFIGTVS